ncbi:MAG: S-methyl-5'-thioadenosine phosphorylase [Sphingomonadaceae bacterium]
MGKPLKLGIIGGSGLYAMPGLSGAWRAVETPWGPPSDAILEGALEGLEVAFLPRHGRGHRVAPGELNARANIAALKLLGCTAILAVGAVGSFREHLPPGHFALPEQIVDATRGRQPSFFGDGIVAHVSLAVPVATDLVDRVETAAKAAGVPATRGITYCCMEGPQFATRAESRARRAAGMDVVGMTAMPEAALAREAELAYALVSMVTDFDSWAESDVTTASVLAVMEDNRTRAQALVRAVARELVANPLPVPSAQGWERALDGAILTARDRWPEATRQRLLPIAGRVLA